MIERKFKKGSIALMNMIMISAVLLLVVIGVSNVSVTNSREYLNLYLERDLFHVAEGCLEEGIVRIERDPSVASLDLDIGNVNCQLSVSGGSSKTVDIVVTSGDYVQDFSAVLSLTTQGVANNVNLIEWKKN